MDRDLRGKILNCSFAAGTRSAVPMDLLIEGLS
jgi:hypothetical protein